MPAPFISDFGDESHEEGETGLSVAGQDFGSGIEGQGALWMFANADRSGASDSLTYSSHTDTDISGVEMPAAPNNVPGTVFLAWQRFGDNAWSNSYQFTLTEASAPAIGTPDRVAPVRMRQRHCFPFGGFG